jgi:hypothetical protein
MTQRDKERFVARFLTAHPQLEGNRAVHNAVELWEKGGDRRQEKTP